MLSVPIQPAPLESNSVNPPAYNIPASTAALLQLQLELLELATAVAAPAVAAAGVAIIIYFIKTAIRGFKNFHFPRQGTRLSHFPGQQFHMGYARILASAVLTPGAPGYQFQQHHK